tara:strand:+ start:175170 stop:176057 length:888 start_codon:yes stop_codon:yes gene_type:complete
MLSILIPTYNYNVASLVESLSGQLKEVDYLYEIIVADDASNNLGIVQKNRFINQLPHTRYLEQKENQGRTATRNFLAQSATYEWLLFMDADVLPKKESFIQNFDIKNNTSDVVFGGISYEEKPPEKDKILRWKYGKSREAKPVSEREKIPHLSIISQCFLIKKDLFLKANNFYENVYGVDVLFAQNLEKMNACVKHINNPIIHYGLEKNTSFIEKTKKGLESLYVFEKENKIPEDYRPIQKAYQTLKKNGALNLFKGIVGFFEKSIHKNLKSSSPSLFLFDLYRLYYYVNLQSKP